MDVRSLTAADLVVLDWLDDGTRTGLAVAVGAGPGRALMLAASGPAGPVGVLAADLPPWRGRTEPWLWLVEVRPGCRGRGTGTALLAEAHRRLATAGHLGVELAVDDTNVRAAALYRRLGYAAVGSGTGPGDPWTTMRRALSA
ncbi:GNAT family N-acetyltransferase [Blastococcus litoris]|uniref:GNAT family N-acetyltransferase n=1 Tax=Blastococcus litoris TaxID=2171622 RepID=UPI000E309FF2|nr:GNAT family N-acetyltransferase [Blastococcus litoris]